MKRSDITAKEKSVMFLQLLPIALSSDCILLHQDYCSDFESKLRTRGFFFVVSLAHTAANSHKEEGNYDTCVC